MAVNELTADTFQAKVINSEGLVLIDFWGPQCAPCLALSPQVDTLASTYQDVVTVFKVDASQNRRLCINLRVMGLPTFLLFRNGIEIDRLSGNMSGQQIKTMLEKALGQLMVNNE